MRCAPLHASLIRLPQCIVCRPAEAGTIPSITPSAHARGYILKRLLRSTSSPKQKKRPNGPPSSSFIFTSLFSLLLYFILRRQTAQSQTDPPPQLASLPISPLARFPGCTRSPRARGSIPVARATLARSSPRAIPSALHLPEPESLRSQSLLIPPARGASPAKHTATPGIHSSLPAGSPAPPRLRPISASQS